MVLFSLVCILCIVFLLVCVGLIMAWTQLGKTADGQRLNKIEKSPNYIKGKFQMRSKEQDLWDWFRI